MKFFFRTLGCKMNFLDSARIGAVLQNAGHIPAKNEDEADIIFVNSCTVTARADRQSRQEASHAFREKVQVAVFGCSVKVNYDRWKKQNPEYLLFRDEKEIFDYFGIQEDDITFPLHEKTRVPIAIQTGCDNFCTFCITRIARGKTEDFPLESIVQQAKRAEEAGIQEIVLTGIQLASWGCTDSLQFPKSSRLAEVIEALLEHTNIPRIRMSSLGPQFLNNSFWKVFENPRVCDHLHLSIQSGSDRVLEKMNRGHGTKEVWDIVEKARLVRPYTAFTADFIMGFPGETEEDVQETLRMVETICFAHLHVFPYSEREGTGAANFPEKIPVPERKARAKRLRDLADQTKQCFVQQSLGRKITILCEQDETGLTSNYIRVAIPEGKNNTLYTTTLSKENIVVLS